MNWFKRNDIDYADVLIGSLAIFLMVLPISLFGYGAIGVAIENSENFIASIINFF